MTCVTPSLLNKGVVEGRGTTKAFPGIRDVARLLVSTSSSGPAALNIAAFVPPPPGFSLLHGLSFQKIFLTCKLSLQMEIYCTNIH